MKTFEVVIAKRRENQDPVVQTIEVEAESSAEAERMAWEGFYATVGPAEAAQWRVGYIVHKGEAYDDE